jgi:hypothetical protein
MAPPFEEMDFAGWFEAFLRGEWFTFDPRNNIPRIGRVLIGRGRDAVDVAISTTFGPNTLSSFIEPWESLNRGRRSGLGPLRSGHRALGWRIRLAKLSACRRTKSRFSER